MVLFLAQMLFGLLAGLQFLWPDFLHGTLDFNVNRMVHINAMIVWMLYGFIGAIYWLVEDEAGVPLVGIRLAQATFWVFSSAVAAVVVVFLVVQTVHEETNPHYHALLQAFKAKTGCPVIVNTSFNVRGEPIVCTPDDAFRCFMGTDLDCLAIGNCLLHKEDQDPAGKVENYQASFDPD